MFKTMVFWDDKNERFTYLELGSSSKFDDQPWETNFVVFGELHPSLFYRGFKIAEVDVKHEEDLSFWDMICVSHDVAEDYDWEILGPLELIEAKHVQ